MNKEDREWLDQLIKENKESASELTYTYCPFSVLYALQQENKELYNKLKKGSELIKIKTKIIPLEDGGGLELCDYDILNLLEILKDSDLDE